jgi:uncharacterized protein YndB with AHSA1/START domain
MMTESPPKLRITRRYNASPELVFDAWIDPCPYALSSVAQWLTNGIPDRTPELEEFVRALKNG